MPRNGDIRKPLVELGARTEDCWLWKGRIAPDTGYGKKQWHGETWLAHRWVYTMLLGPIPDGMCIDHVCGNRQCVNPHHLRAVSQAENCRSGNGTKLNIDAVRAIKRAKASKKWGDGARLARKYGVTTALIHDIWNGRAWREIE